LFADGLPEYPSDKQRCYIALRYADWFTVTSIYYRFLLCSPDQRCQPILIHRVLNLQWIKPSQNISTLTTGLAQRIFSNFCFRCLHPGVLPFWCT